MKNTLGKNIRHIRKNHNLSLRKLGKMSGVSFVTIHDIETGRVDPRISNVVKIADALNVDVHNLLTEYNRLGDSMTDKTYSICVTCNGNGTDLPCAYPGENKPGCKQIISNKCIIGPQEGINRFVYSYKTKTPDEGG